MPKPEPTKSAWQPIETAPKDRFVLIYDPNVNSVHVAMWTQEVEDWVPEGWDMYSDTVDASHWMPIPEPPNA